MAVIYVMMVKNTRFSFVEKNPAKRFFDRCNKSPTEVGLFVMVPRFAAVSAGTHNRFTGAKGNWSISRQTNDLEATMAKSLQIRLKNR